MNLTDSFREMQSASPRRIWHLTAFGLALVLTSTIVPTDVLAADRITFEMVPSEAAEESLADVRAVVRVRSLGPVERMTVLVEGLPPRTELDLFVTQLPNSPFGLSWYQGDLETNSRGTRRGVFIGGFNVETFIVAPGVGPAPVVHEDGRFRTRTRTPRAPRSIPSTSVYGSLIRRMPRARAVRTMSPLSMAITPPASRP
jgi:hypothetical protein